VASGASRATSGFDPAQEGALLREDKPVLLGEIEIRHAFVIGAQPRAICLVSREAFERDQRALPDRSVQARVAKQASFYLSTALLAA
jgi:hypothetical protein